MKLLPCRAPFLNGTAGKTYKRERSNKRIKNSREETSPECLKYQVCIALLRELTASGLGEAELLQE